MVREGNYFDRDGVVEDMADKIITEHDNEMEDEN